MQKIMPHLWYDHQAREAAEFYTTIFPQSRINDITVLRDTPSGDCDLVSFELWGEKFMSISAGPLFHFNPSVSFMVNFDPQFFKSEGEATEKLDFVWGKLSESGTALMPLDEYPFSKRYGWIQDKYGVSWQLMLTNPEGKSRPAIVPSIMFVGENAGRAEEAIKFYTSVFKNAKIGSMHRYGANQAPDKEGTVMFADFMLQDFWLAAMDSAHEHQFEFNEAISLMVYCESQEEIDYYWKKLSAVPEAEQCGWLKDKFGLSWQIVPVQLHEMMSDKDQERFARVTKAFLKMKKFDLAELENAYNA